VGDARGFTLVELLIVIVILAIVLSMSIAGYRNARIRGGEAAAIASLEAINQAQFAFMQTCGRQKYAPTLPSLGVPTPAGAPYLSPDLTQADEFEKSGYLLRMGGTPVEEADLQTCTGVTPLTGYQATADPTLPGSTGIRYFGTNGDRVIYEDTATFAGNMPETGSPGRGVEIADRSR
jgi:prepilin-type N-terminal cleavage/methylation domain-containing protein